MEPKTFAFDINQGVVLSLTGESGVVVGRAEYFDSAPQYLVRYAAGDGRQVEHWWASSAISAV